MTEELQKGIKRASRAMHALEMQLTATRSLAEAAALMANDIQVEALREQLHTLTDRYLDEMVRRCRLIRQHDL